MTFYPSSESHHRHYSGMPSNPPDLSDLSPEEIESRKVLAQNLHRLMAARPKLNSNPKLSKRSGVGIATLSRILNMSSAATLDTVTRLASAFEMTPWQMLVPGLDPSNPQILRSTSPAEEALYSKLREVVELEVQARGHENHNGHP